MPCSRSSQRFLVCQTGSCIVIATVLWIGAVGNLISTWYLPSNCDDYMDVNSDGVVNQQELMVAADSNQDGLITGNEMRAGVQPYYDCQSRYYSSAAFITFSTLGGIFLCGMCCLTMLVRRHVRHRDNIPATVCAGLDDCLCATCCLPCAQCQIMRHEGLIGAKYKLFSPNGSVGFDSMGRTFPGLPAPFQRPSTALNDLPSTFHRHPPGRLRRDDQRRLLAPRGGGGLRRWCELRRPWQTSSRAVCPRRAETLR